MHTISCALDILFRCIPQYYVVPPRNTISLDFRKLFFQLILIFQRKTRNFAVVEAKLLALVIKKNKFFCSALDFS